MSQMAIWMNKGLRYRADSVLTEQVVRALVRLWDVDDRTPNDHIYLKRMYHFVNNAMHGVLCPPSDVLFFLEQLGQLHSCVQFEIKR